MVEVDCKLGPGKLMDFKNFSKDFMWGNIGVRLREHKVIT